MTILHLYDDSDAMAARYVAVLTQAIGARAQVSSATSATTLQKAIEQQQPDIVHVHGLPRVGVPRVGRVVVTPHGHKLPTALKPYVVIARSTIEQQALQFERTEVVRNPLITRTTTLEDCARQMLAVYRRVMQSDVLALMNTTTRRALGMLLLAGITGDRRWLGETDMEPIFSNAHFQQLYIYAHHEGVLPLLKQGLQVVGHIAPPIEPFHSYLPPDYQQPQPMDGADIPTLLADVKANGPSMLRLCELATALRSDSLDEARLLSQLSDQLRPLLASTLQLLDEQNLITEGFMPCTPVDDGNTRLLRRQLTRRQHI